MPTPLPTPKYDPLRIVDLEARFDRQLRCPRVVALAAARMAATAWSAAIWSVAEAAGPLGLTEGEIEHAFAVASHPVFIVGVHRSGTTLTRDLLDHHPALSVLPAEGSMFTHFEWHLKRLEPSQWLGFLGCEWLRRLANPINQQPYWLLGRSSEISSPYVDFGRALIAWWPLVHARLGERITAWPLVAIALAYAHCRPGFPTVRRWVEKTPGNERFLSRLAVEFPGAKWIHVVRHPVAVFASHRRLAENSGRPLRGGCRILQQLRRSYLAAASGSVAPASDLRLLVRYEDLLEDTSGSVDRIAAFLGIQPLPILMRPTANGIPTPSNSSFREDDVAGRLNRRIPDAAIGALARRDRERVSAVLADAVDSLGYQLGRVPVLRRNLLRLQAWAGWLVDCLRARCAGFVCSRVVADARREKPRRWATRPRLHGAYPARARRRTVAGKVEKVGLAGIRFASSILSLLPSGIAKRRSAVEGSKMQSLPDDALGRLVPAFMVPFAIWTMYVHLVTATHSSFVTLLHGLPLVALGALAATVGWFRLSGPARRSDVVATGGAAAARRLGAPVPQPHGAGALPFAVLALASLWVGCFSAGMPYTVFWWGALLASFWAWRGNLRTTLDSAPGGTAAQRPPWSHAPWVVLVVAVAAVCVTLVANRPDPDDALHLSIPATLLRFPQQPLLLHDTLLRLPDAPILTPFYRLNSYDVLIGLLARISRVDLHVIAYLVLPAFFAVLCVLAWVQLLRWIMPGRWPSVLSILFLCVLALGESHRAYGNFAFVRLFQGKAILVSCMVPVIAGSALAFARNGGARNWLLLFAAEVAALGTAATALFVAPAAAALGLAGGWSADAGSSRRVALGILASTYVFAAAWAMTSATHGGGDFVSSSPVLAMPRILDDAWGPWSTRVLLVVLLAAWAFVRDPLRARYFSAGAFFFLLVVLDPYTSRFVADHLAGVYTYWRLTWALPLPIFLAVVLDAVVRRALLVRPRMLAVCACIVLAGSAATFGWRFGTLRAGNAVTLGAPGLKVYPVEYPVARQVAEEMPEDGVVLAPELVAIWLPTFVVHPRPLGVRSLYLTRHFARSEAQRRYALMRYVAGLDRQPDSATLFADALQRYRLTAVVLKHSAPWLREMEEVLAKSGWHPLSRDAYDVWMKGAAAPSGRAGVARAGAPRNGHRTDPVREPRPTRPTTAASWPR